MAAYYLMCLHGWHEVPAGSWTEAAAGDLILLVLKNPFLNASIFFLNNSV